MKKLKIEVKKDEIKQMEKLNKQLIKVLTETREKLDKMQELFYKAYCNKNQKIKENE